MFSGLYDCPSVCWLRPWVLQKRLNWLRCHLWLPKELRIRCGCTSAPPGEYNGSVGSAAATLAVTNITIATYQHTHTHPCNGPLSGTTRVSRYQKGKTNLDFTEARDSEWQWHQLGHMQVCTSLKADNHANTPLAGCPSCRPTNSVKALKANLLA